MRMASMLLKPSVKAVRLALAWMQLSRVEQARRLSLYAPSAETSLCAAKS